jgi:hypothetical protein
MENDSSDISALTSSFIDAIKAPDAQRGTEEEITSVFSQTGVKSHKDIQNAVGAMAEAKTRIFATMISSYDTTMRLICQAYLFGIEAVFFMPDFHFPGGDALGYLSAAGLEESGCTIDQMEHAVEGVMPVTMGVQGSATTKEPAGRSPPAWYAEFNKRTAAKGVADPGAVSNSYDAVWAWAFALDKMIQDGHSAASLRFPFVANPTMGLKLWKKLNQTKFQGVSGAVSFDTSGNRVGIDVIIRSLRGSSYPLGTILGRYNAHQKKCASCLPRFEWGNTTWGSGVTWAPGRGDPAYQAPEEYGNVAPPDGSSAPIMFPAVSSISPGIIAPMGGTRVTLRGLRFLQTRVGDSSFIVRIGGAICQSPVVVTSMEAYCTAPPGVGLRQLVDVNTNGRQSKAKALITYMPPVIRSIAPYGSNRLIKLWGVVGMEFEAHGSHFVDSASMMCRLGSTGPSTRAQFVSSTVVRCTIPSGSSGGLGALMLSNDMGARWIGGITLRQDVRWYNGNVMPSDAPLRVPRFVYIGVLTPDANEMSTLIDNTTMSHAAQRAATKLNTALFLPYSTTLKIVLIPRGGWDAADMIPAVNAAHKKYPNMIGIVGGIGTTLSLAMASASNSLLLPVISIYASSTELSSTATFPYFTRV